MPRDNPFSPPKAHVSDSADPSDVDIDSLPVSETWKTRFHWLRTAGGRSMKNLKNMSRTEQQPGFHFNILAFLFGPLYYVAKGMWRKGISLFIVCIAVVIAIDFFLVAIGFGQMSKALGYGVAAVYAVRANVDYYKKMVLGDNGWW